MWSTPEAWERRKGKGHQLRKQELTDAGAHHRRQRRYSPNPTTGRAEAGHAYECVRVDLDLPLPSLQRIQAAGRKSLCSDHTPKPTSATWKFYVRTHTRHRAETALGKHCDQNRTSKIPLWSVDLTVKKWGFPKHRGLPKHRGSQNTCSTQNDPIGGVGKCSKSLIFK